MNSIPYMLVLEGLRHPVEQFRDLGHHSLFTLRHHHQEGCRCSKVGLVQHETRLQSIAKSLRGNARDSVAHEHEKRDKEAGMFPQHKKSTHTHDLELGVVV